MSYRRNRRRKERRLDEMLLNVRRPMEPSELRAVLRDSRGERSSRIPSAGGEGLAEQPIG